MTSDDDPAARLATVLRAGFFRGLSRESAERLARVASRRDMARREILFREEDRGGTMFLLQSGAVQLLKATPDGGSVPVRTLRPGDVFAEVVLVEEDRYPVTAVTLTPSVVLGFPRAQVLALLDQPDFRRDFLAMLMRKQRYLAERVRYLTAHDVAGRLLLFLAEQYGTETSAFTVPLSKKDVAAAIGTTPETLSRTLLKLQREEILTWRGRRVRLSPDAFRAITLPPATPPARSVRGRKAPPGTPS